MKVLENILRNILGIAIVFSAVGCQKKPSACFSTGQNLVAEGEVMFNNCSTGAAAYRWNFGDGTTSNESSPKHVYSVAGNYTVKLEAFSKGDTKKEEISQVITVKKSFYKRIAGFWNKNLIVIRNSIILPKNESLDFISRDKVVLNKTDTVNWYSEPSGDSEKLRIGADDWGVAFTDGKGDPSDNSVILRKLPSPGGGEDSYMEWHLSR